MLSVPRGISELLAILRSRGPFWTIIYLVLGFVQLLLLDRIAQAVNFQIDSAVKDGDGESMMGRVWDSIHELLASMLAWMSSNPVGTSFIALIIVSAAAVINASWAVTHPSKSPSLLDKARFQWPIQFRSETAPRGGHDGDAAKELDKCRKDHAKARIRWFAERVEMVAEWRRTEGKPVKDVRVTVRFADYGDLDLAQQIEEVIKQCAKWPVEIDGSNNPTIMPEKEFKVVFEVGPFDDFIEVAAAFGAGELVKAKIGKKTNHQFVNREHLIICVHPTVTQ